MSIKFYREVKRRAGEVWRPRGLSSSLQRASLSVLCRRRPLSFLEMNVYNKMKIHGRAAALWDFMGSD